MYWAGRRADKEKGRLKWRDSWEELRPPEFGLSVTGAAAIRALAAATRD
jgi:hypothetical protein